MGFGLLSRIETPQGRCSGDLFVCHGCRDKYGRYGCFHLEEWTLPRRLCKLENVTAVVLFLRALVLITLSTSLVMCGVRYPSTHLPDALWSVHHRSSCTVINHVPSVRVVELDSETSDLIVHTCLVAIVKSEASVQDLRSCTGGTMSATEARPILTMSCQLAPNFVRMSDARPLVTLCCRVRQLFRDE